MKEIIKIKPIQQITDEAHERYTKIVGLRKDMNTRFWVLVKELKVCRENKDWEVLGYESWGSYLAQPEIDLSAHTVDNYLSIFNTLLIQKVVPPAGVDISKLEVIAPHLTKENAEELITKAKILSRSDLREEFGEKKEIIKHLIKCPRCGFEF